jgi:uncharacterized protein (DUF1330 family)
LNRALTLQKNINSRVGRSRTQQGLCDHGTVSVSAPIHFLNWRTRGFPWQVEDRLSLDPEADLKPGVKSMTAFLIADIKVTDDKWVPEYATSVHAIVHKHGGKYLARSGNVRTLEGAPLDTSLIAIIAFPSPKQAEAFVADPAYAPYIAARRRGSESRFQLIDDTDLAGTISYLTKG